MWWQSKGNDFYEASIGRCFKVSEKFFFSRRNEATDWYKPLLCLIDDFVYFKGVFLSCFAHSEAYMVKKWRAEQGEISHSIPTTAWVKYRMLYVGEAYKAVGMACFPNCTGWVKTDVASNCFELLRIEGKFNVTMTIPFYCCRKRAVGYCERTKVFVRESNSFSEGFLGFGGKVPVCSPNGFSGIHQAMGCP